MSLVDDLGLDVLDVLQNTFGIDGEVIIDEYRILCPNPKHDDHEPSCYVRLTPKVNAKGRRLEAGTWHCFSCHAKGDLINLGHFSLNRKKSEVRKLLEPGNIDGQIALVQRRLTSILRPVDGRVSPAERERAWRERPWLEKDARKLDSYDDGPKTYLLKRGFSVATIKKWGVRYVRSASINAKSKNGEERTVTIKHSIAIPICDRDGRLLAWCYRRTDESESWQPKYLYTHNSPRSLVWIGEHLHVHARSIVLVEGALDAMWLDQFGIPALAVGGSGVDVDRARSLVSFGFHRLTLFMDRDEAGQWAARNIGSALWERIPVFVARYRKSWQGDDPQTLDEDELHYAVEHAIPWTAWQLRLHLSGLPG